MLHGLLIFHEETGSLIFHKRFSRGFGLPGAVAEPSVADPIGLALQLYAFNKFSGSLSETSKLEHFSVSFAGVDVCLASGNLSKTSSKSPVILALFSKLPLELSKRVAALFLDHFLSEQALQANTDAIDKNDPSALHVSRQITPRGEICRFVTLDECLHVVLDLLVSALHDHLPGEAQWLTILHTPFLQFSSGVASRVPSNEELAHTPRPPAEPPPGRSRSSGSRSRPPLARRMLQKLPGSSLFSPRGPKVTAKTAFLSDEASPNFDSVVQHENRSVSAPPLNRDRCVQKMDQDVPIDGVPEEVPAQGRASWWFSRRSKSQNAISREKSMPKDANTIETNSTCYCYNQEAASGDVKAMERVTDLSSRVWRSSVAHASSTSSTCVETFDLSECALESNDSVVRVHVAMLSLIIKDSKLTVGLPMHALLSDVCECSPKQFFEVAVSARRALDLELTAISEYIRFLESTQKRSANAEAKSMRQVAPANTTNAKNSQTVVS